MQKIYIVLVICLFFGSCNLFESSYYDLESKYVNLVVENDSLDFSRDRWIKGNPVENGKMLASLLRSYSFLELTNNDVFDLLGESECYYNYEDEPCYLVQYVGKIYRLKFGVNHSDNPGKITDVGLYEY
jgi:hypothetical protein